MFEFDENIDQVAKIKVVGVGGGGSNAVNTMIAGRIDGVEFMVANTDAQSLEVSKAPLKIQLGEQLTEGLGAGANPDVGREAAIETGEALRVATEERELLLRARLDRTVRRGTVVVPWHSGRGGSAATLVTEIGAPQPVTVRRRQ